MRVDLRVLLSVLSTPVTRVAAEWAWTGSCRLRRSSTSCVGADMVRNGTNMVVGAHKCALAAMLLIQPATNGRAR